MTNKLGVDMTKYISCNKCLLELPVTSFSKATNTSRGYQYKCKECTAKYHCENIAKIKSKKRDYYSAHKQQIITKSALWQKNNPEKVKEKNAKWSNNNQGKHLERTHRRRARKLANKTFDISTKEMNALYMKPCLYCGSTKNISADHVIPVAKGGTHSIGNLVPACQSCNSSKGARTITEWKQIKRKATGQPTTR